MFIAIGHRAPEAPQSFGPFNEFAQAAASIAGLDFRTVMEFSCVYGLLGIWEGRDDRFELLHETAATVVLQSRRGDPASRLRDVEAAAKS